MKTSHLLLCFALWAASAAMVSADDAADSSNYGTLDLRLQTLSMIRDYEGNGNGSSSTLGVKLDYTTPTYSGVQLGASYIWADDVHEAGGRYGDGNHGEALLSNGRLNVLNEAWVAIDARAFTPLHTMLKVGRQVLNTEVLRKDEFRQKPRGFEAAVLQCRNVPGLAVTLGHLERLSNVWGDNDQWQYHEIEDVLLRGTDLYYETDGLDWAEALYTGIDGLECALFDAYAHDIANLAGTRIKLSLTDHMAVSGYYRQEQSVARLDDDAPFDNETYGVSLHRVMGSVQAEAGVFSVHGDDLLFQEVNTGIHHPLGASMMMYPAMFNGGADTAYLKAVTTIHKTLLYLLYHYTLQDHSENNFHGQEVNVVVKQTLSDRFSVAVKAAWGYRDNEGDVENTTATDGRLFVTYTL